MTIDSVLASHEWLFDKHEAMYADLVARVLDPAIRAIGGVGPSPLSEDGARALFEMSELPGLTDTQQARIDALLARHQAALQSLMP